MKSKCEKFSRPPPDHLPLSKPNASLIQAFQKVQAVSDNNRWGFRLFEGLLL